MMKNLLQTRGFHTVMMSLPIVSAIMLWYTRSVDLESESLYAISDNVFWYNSMHGSAISAFSAYSVWKNDTWAFLIAFGMWMILATNLYHYEMAHDISTGVTIAYALGWLISKATSMMLRLQFTMLAVAALLVFGVSYFTSAITIFFGEVIVKACVVTGVLWLIWKGDK